MSNTNDKGLSSCTGICWLLSAGFGLLVVYFIAKCTALALIVAIVVGLIGMLGAYWVLSSYFCDGLDTDTVVLAEKIGESDTRVDAAPVATKAADVTKAAAQTADVQTDTVAEVPVEQPQGLAATQGDTPALYTAVPSAVDDLKKIKGVGPALEKTLNELGIYTYAQIAVWSAENIAWVDGNLKFKGRITRDDWISQAKSLSSGSDT